MTPVDRILAQLAELIQRRRFDELETDGLEIKPVPAEGLDWKQLHVSANAFLNTRGGIMILGIKEEGSGADRRYVFSGWQGHAENKLKEIPKQFTDRKGIRQELSDCFPLMEIREFLNGRVVVIYIDELAADRRFVFYQGKAFKRLLTGDHVIPDREVDSQEEYKDEAVHARELQPVRQMTEADLDLAKLNQFIFQLNQPVNVETMKPDIEHARPFLQRRCFLKDGAVTVLGALVCGKYPGDHLGFRSHVHGYVDVPHQIAQDKQDYVDNVLQLMESSLGYILRNIQVGITAAHGGTSRPQYPEELLRETVNNALAHRDYSINKQVIISIKPGSHVAIRNPGAFRRHLLIEDVDHPIPLRRILPEAKPRNPKLADVLRVFRKWEGRAIGMATLVNLCLQDQMDLPYYRIYSEDVCLYLKAGKLLDERMERLFQSFDGYVESKLQGSPLSIQQKLVLSYLIKSEWANQQLHYTIQLTPDNNHSAALLGLERAELIVKHPASTANYPIYVADRVFMSRDYVPELRDMFGPGFDCLDQKSKAILGIVYRFNRFSKETVLSAKKASFSLWYERDDAPEDIQQFDRFYRGVRTIFNKLEKSGFVYKTLEKRGSGYRLATDFLKTHLV